MNFACLRLARNAQSAVLALAAAVLPAAIAHAASPPAVVARPVAYRLELTILPERPTFDGHVEIDVDLADATSSLVIDGQDLQVKRAMVRQGAPRFAPLIASSTRMGTHGSISRACLWRDARHWYWIMRPPSRKRLQGSTVQRSMAAGTSGLISKHGTLGACLRAFDRAGFKAPFTVSVTTTSDLVATSNGAEQPTEAAGALVRHRFASTAPLPTYLVAVAVGPCAVSSTNIAPNAARTISVPLRILAPQAAGSAELALTQTGPILEKLEAYMGRRYPYAKVDQIASPLMPGGMENAAAIIYDQDTLMPQDPRSPAARRPSFVWWRTSWRTNGLAIWSPRKAGMIFG